MSKQVLFTGATGYIGGAALAYLLTDSKSSLSFTCLVRNAQKAAALESLGVRVIVGTLDDSEKITEEAGKADIVIHTADSSDHVGSCKAIVAGLTGRNDNPIYIHVSGTGVLTDDARGEYASDEIYSDLDPDHINRIPDSAFHRNVELLVLKASEQGIRTHIISPSTIYGIADHLLVKKGISNPISVQMPQLIRVGIDRKQGAIMGKGANLWPNIHITEIASLIGTVLEAALEGKTVTGWEGYYFGESGEYKIGDACVAIAKALHARGIGTPEPTPLSKEEVDKYFGGSYYLGTNSRCKGERARALGWKSTHKNQDFLKSLDIEVENVLRLDKGKQFTKPDKL